MKQMLLTFEVHMHARAHAHARTHKRFHSFETRKPIDRAIYTSCRYAF